jgi:hypothetical protein
MYIPGITCGSLIVFIHGLMFQAPLKQVPVPYIDDKLLKKPVCMGKPVCIMEKKPVSFYETRNS